MTDLSEESILHILEYENGTLDELDIDTFQWIVLKSLYNKAREKLGFSEDSYWLILHCLYMERMSKDTLSMSRMYQEIISKLSAI